MYEINISKNGIHFFATQSNSAKTLNELKNILQVFKNKFPEKEGYKITVLENVNYFKIITEEVINIC